MQLIRRFLRLDAALVTTALCGAVLLGVLQADDRHDSYGTISEDLEPFRSAFNADPGNVRAVLLASPT